MIVPQSQPPEAIEAHYRIVEVGAAFSFDGESADHVEISLHSQPPEADFAAPSSDDVDELGRSRGSQMTLPC